MCWVSLNGFIGTKTGMKWRDLPFKRTHSKVTTYLDGCAVRSCRCCFDWRQTEEAPSALRHSLLNESCVSWKCHEMASDIFKSQLVDILVFYTPLLTEKRTFSTLKYTWVTWNGPHVNIDCPLSVPHCDVYPWTSCTLGLSTQPSKCVLEVKVLVFSLLLTANTQWPSCTYQYTLFCFGIHLMFNTV